MSDLIWQIPLGVFLLVLTKAVWEVIRENRRGNGDA